MEGWHGGHREVDDDDDKDEEFQGPSWNPITLAVGSQGKGIRKSGQSNETPITQHSRILVPEGVLSLG